MRKLFALLLIFAGIKAAAVNIDSVGIGYHSDYDYYTMEMTGELNAPLQIFLDTDNNENTGYSNKDDDVYGADFRIEVGSINDALDQVYAYEGGNGSDWKWSKQSQNDVHFVDNVLYIDMDRSSMGMQGEANDDGFGYRIQIWNKDWNNIEASYPQNGGMMHYDPKQNSAFNQPVLNAKLQIQELDGKVKFVAEDDCYTFAGNLITFSIWDNNLKRCELRMSKGEEWKLSDDMELSGEVKLSGIGGGTKEFTWMQLHYTNGSFPLVRFAWIKDDKHTDAVSGNRYENGLWAIVRKDDQSSSYYYFGSTDSMKGRFFSSKIKVINEGEQLYLEIDGHSITIDVPDLWKNRKNEDKYYFKAGLYFSGSKNTTREADAQYRTLEMHYPNDETLNDDHYVYQDNEIYGEFDADRKNFMSWRKSDSHDLINTGNDGDFSTHDANLNITYKLEKKTGGFDVVYAISNQGNSSTALPVLQIPGILFGDVDSLNILNPLFKHYLEHRSLQKHENSGEYEVPSQKDFDMMDNQRPNNKTFAVANTLFKKENGDWINKHAPYSGQFVYSPVIVADNGDFAAGTSLQIDWRRYSGLKAYMFIEKKNAAWVYKYDLRASRKLLAGESLQCTISVRFSEVKNWIFTLYPYKDFFNKTYKTGQNRLPSLWKKSRDTRPIQALVISSPESNITRNSGRQFFWGLKFEDNNVTKTLYLKESLDVIGKALKAKGYKRNMLWNFTGTYHFDDDFKNRYGYAIEQQLPFQFLDNPNNDENILLESFAQEMKDVISDDNPTEGLAYLKDVGIGYDWGISGQIPLDKNGTTLRFGTNNFQAHGLAQFNWRDGDNANAKNRYVSEYVRRVKSLDNTIFAPKFIRLDALFRKDLADRVYWLAYLKEQFPHTTFATESSIDYMHAQAPMINQLDTTENPKTRGSFEEVQLRQPDFLAYYLNPTVENVVNLDSSFIGEGDRSAKKKYISDLTKRGYTPLVKWPDVEIGKLDTSLVDVKNMPAADPCLDGAPKRSTWPYDDECRERWNYSEDPYH